MISAEKKAAAHNIKIVDSDTKSATGQKTANNTGRYADKLYRTSGMNTEM